MGNERSENHVCPHCGQRNRPYGQPVCPAGEEQYRKMVKDAAAALLRGAEVPQTWDNVFAWAYYLGTEETLPRLVKEFGELKAAAAKRKTDIRNEVVAKVASRMRGHEGSIPAEVRDTAIDMAIAGAEYEDEAIKRAHGRGLGLDDLKRHLQWLRSQMGDSGQRQTA